MSRFVTNTLKQIDISQGDWIKIPSALSYADCLAMQELQGLSQGEQGLKVALLIIKEWSFKNEDGVIEPVTEDNIKKLDLETFLEISNVVAKEIDSLTKKKTTTTS